MHLMHRIADLEAKLARAEAENERLRTRLRLIVNATRVGDYSKAQMDYIAAEAEGGLAEGVGEKGESG